MIDKEQLICSVNSFKDRIPHKHFLDRIDYILEHDRDEPSFDINEQIKDFANEHIDIYDDDLFDWAKGNISIIDETIQEFGVSDNCGITNIIAMAQVRQIEDDLQENVEDIISYIAFAKTLDIVETKNLNSITQKQYDEIEEYCYGLDGSVNIEDIVNFVKKTCLKTKFEEELECEQYNQQIRRKR